MSHLKSAALLLLLGASSISKTHDQQTFTQRDLLTACSSGDFQKVQGLLLAGMSPNITSSYYLSDIPLQEAAKNGHYDIVRELLAYGAEINAQDYRNDTALKWAAFNGHYAIVELLLNYGADLHIRDFDGYTALLDAVRRNQFEIARLLLSRGANPCDTDNSGKSAYHHACSNYSYDIMDLLHAWAPPCVPVYCYEYSCIPCCR